MRERWRRGPSSAHGTGPRFDLRTGRQTLPAPKPLKVFPARLEEETVLLDL
jgi:hypothetical protein